MTIRFYLPESEDRVDPSYDFERDSCCETRVKGVDHDVYAHELYGGLQCDGLLVTRSLINERRRERIVSVGGIHKFLRLPDKTSVIADCGAFQYRDEEFPPYSCEDTCEFYDDLGFDYGISLDHMILEFDPDFDDNASLIPKSPTPEMERRFRLTIENAKTMSRLCAKKKRSFKLIGGVQGWSPRSYRVGVEELVRDGFSYLALGGLARATDGQIRSVLDEIRPVVQESRVKLHILGVARLSLFEDFVSCNVASCDSASALLQAFKSNKDNYHSPKRNYTAVRIPPATGTLSPKVRKLLRQVEKEGGVEAAHEKHQTLIDLEKASLFAIREYARGRTSLGRAMTALIAYEDEFGDEKRYYPLFEETLRDRPWDDCPCEICRSIGVEVVILRGNNRNRRRGFHNTWVFYQQFSAERERLAAAGYFPLGDGLAAAR